jgi:type I restriction enzyme S subunit
MVPNGWSKVYLKNILTSNVKNGFSPNAVEVETGYVVLGLGALTDGKLNLSEIKNVEPIEAVKKSLLTNGDFLVSRSNTPDKVGRSAIFRGEIKNCSYPDLMMRFTINQDIADLEFIEALLKSSKVRQYYKSCASGSSSSMVKITKPIVEKTPIELPPLPEQRKMANILGTWDKAIRTTERLIDNSKQQKKALMQQLLTGKKHLLDDSGKPFEVEWQELKLSDIVKVTGGNAFKSETFQPDGVPLVKISNIKSDYSVNLDSTVFISQDPKFDKFQIKSGDVLIAMSGATTGKVGCYQSNNPAYLNQRVGRFDVKKGHTTNKYILQLLKLPKIQHEILIDAVGGAQPNISNKDIERIKVDIPSVEEQVKIASVLTNADKEVGLLEQQLSDLKREKKALMQQLLTGKRRVIV